MFCPHCGSQIDDSVVFCPGCGKPVNDAPAAPAVPAAVPYVPAPQPPVPVYTENDDVASLQPWQIKGFVKIMAIICYLGSTVFLPMFLLKQQKYVRGHANNGLVLFIFSAGAGVFSSIPIVGWFLGLPFLVFLAVLEIMGIVKAAKGQNYNMPLLGKIRILK